MVQGGVSQGTRSALALNSAPEHHDAGTEFDRAGPCARKVQGIR